MKQTKEQELNENYKLCSHEEVEAYEKGKAQAIKEVLEIIDKQKVIYEDEAHDVNGKLTLFQRGIDKEELKATLQEKK